MDGRAVTFTGLCAIVIALALSILTSPVVAAGPPPPGFNVNVVNPLPLPVQGTVNINSLPATPLNVRDVDNPARSAFGQSVGCAVQDSTSCQSTVFVVPANKIAVIEDFSGTCTTDPTNPPLVVGLSVSSEALPGTPLQATVALLPNQTGNPVTWQFGRTVRLYAPAGATVRFNLAFLEITLSDRCDGHVSGYFVNQ